jgi:hypothetical protein
MHGSISRPSVPCGPPPMRLPPSQDENVPSFPYGRSPSVLVVLDRRGEIQNTRSGSSTNLVDTSENVSGVTAMATVVSEEDLTGPEHAAGDF